MSLTKGSKVEASDWNNLADAYNSEIVDRRKVTNVKITILGGSIYNEGTII